MKITKKHFLSLALIVTMFGLPMLVGAQWVYDREIGDTGLVNTDVYDIIFGLLQWLLLILTALAVLGFVISGIMFVTAGGSDERADSAKKWLTYSITGIIVALIGYIIVNLVDNLLRADNI